MARRPATQDIEELPEADRLEPFPHPRHTERLFGHAAAEAALMEAFGSGRMHHAWLISGPEGVGKATLAYRFAKFALALPDERGGATDLSVDRQSIAARQVRALSHPGLLVVRRRFDLQTKRFSASIAVDEVRRLRTFLAHAAEVRAWRVVVVDRADELNVNAANALLKVLEEPPPRVVFLLVSAAPARLIATIRSRCRRLDLALLDSEPLRKAAVQALSVAGLEPVSSEDWPKLQVLARGSVRRLLALSQSAGLQDYERAASLVSEMPNVDWRAVHALAEEVGSPGAEQRFEALFDFTSDLLACLVRAAATGQGDPDDVALAQRLIRPGRLASWAELWERVQREKTDVMALNLDRRAFILTTLGRIEAAARE